MKVTREPQSEIIEHVTGFTVIGEEEKRLTGASPVETSSLTPGCTSTNWMMCVEDLSTWRPGHYPTDNHEREGEG
jgi:hypothetical protein